MITIAVQTAWQKAAGNSGFFFVHISAKNGQTVNCRQSP